jgi:hypothetical protein
MEKVKKQQIELPIIYSSNFRNTLNNITHSISDYLLEKENIFKSLYCYIDLGNSCDTISFIQSNKVADLKESDVDWETKVWTSKRCNMKIGKFLQTILGGIFRNNTQRSFTKLKADDIESFVNKYKIEFDFDSYLKNFEIVEGSKILYWYYEENYAESATTSTTLGNSCMRYFKYQKFLEIYKDNPEKIKMLIYKNDNNKLLGRALLWYLDDPENKIFMDRIYCAEDKIIDLFKKYAINNKWYYKSYQTYGYEHALVDTSETPHKLTNLLLSVNLKQDAYYRYLPYLDTLSVLNKLNNNLSNNGKLIDRNGYINCIGYNGYSIIDREALENNRDYNDETFDDDINEADVETVWSNYHEQNIPRNEAKFCEIGNDWVYSNSAVFIFNSGHKYSVPGNSDIEYSRYSNKWFMKNKCVYSDFYQSFLFHESAITVYKNLDNSEYIILHKNDYEKYIEYNTYYYIKELRNEINEDRKKNGISVENYENSSQLVNLFDVEHNNDYSAFYNTIRRITRERNEIRINDYGITPNPPNNWIDYLSNADNNTSNEHNDNNSSSNVNRELYLSIDDELRLNNDNDNDNIA